MQKRYVVIIILLLTLNTLTAQENSIRFGVGYAGGIFTNGHKNLQVHAHTLNKITRPYWTDPMEINPYFHGLNFELHIIGESWGYFAHYQNRHMTFKGSGVNPSTQAEEEMEVKVRVNTFGLMGGEWTRKGWILGASLDIGSAKILIKQKLDDVDDSKFQYLYEKGGKLLSPYTVMGTSVFVQKQLLKRVRLSAHYFHDFFGIDPEGASRIQYKYNMSNLSVGLMFDLISKEERF
jgi:hypothetical protein